MRKVLSCIAVAVALLSASLPAAARRDQASLDRRIAELSEFVRLVTGYTVTARPKVVFKQQEQLDRTYFGDNYTPTLKGWVGALTVSGVIILSDDFQLGRDDHILVHELTHFMQFESGKDGDGCAARLEPEAYRVQDAFVAATGRGQRSDPFTVFVTVSACDAR